MVNSPAVNDWVKQGLGSTATPELVNYYVGKIRGQPGANPTEQAGGATYWLQKMQAGATTPARAAPAVTPYAPTTIGAAASGATAFAPPFVPPSTSAALTVAPYQRRTLGDFFATA